MTEAEIAKKCGRTQEQMAQLCGGCHQWGCNPRIVNGKCDACDRTPEQIVKTHGVLNVI